MKIYRIRITDSYGTPRIVTVKACSEGDALSSVETAEGEIITMCTEI